MTRTLGLWVCALVGALVLLPSGCEERGRPAPPAPGYSGPAPSAGLQRELKLLAGQSFTGSGPLIEEGEWTVINGFSVAPQAAGKGPHATVVRRGVDPAGAGPADLRSLPLTTDEEAHAFSALVRGSAAKPGG